METYDNIFFALLKAVGFDVIFSYERTHFQRRWPLPAGQSLFASVLARFPDIGRLLETELYFAVHADRQSGKTTLLSNTCCPLVNATDVQPKVRLSYL